MLVGDKLMIHARKNKMLKKVVKDVFKINRNPISWEKPIGAAICGAFPILMGLLFHQIRYGLLASMGGFAYLYMFYEPYAQRMKKMFFVSIGITASVALGIFTRPYPILVVVTVALIGAIVLFICGTLKVAGPGPVFFVMIFMMFTGMDLEKQEIPIIIFLIFLVTLLCWGVSMIGYFFNPHGPELKKIKQLYLVLGQFSEAIGSCDITSVRNKVVKTLKETEEILAIGHMPWKESAFFERLVLLNEQANFLFLELSKIHSNKNQTLPKELTERIKKISSYLPINDKTEIEKKQIQHDEIYTELLEIIYGIETIITMPEQEMKKEVNLIKPSVFHKLKEFFHKDSIICSYSIRYGVVLAMSAVIAYQLDVIKPYWITLSCAAVMCGATIASTLNRAIQRSLGTIVGIFLSIVILSIQPKGILLVLFYMVLTILIEVAITQNYALAAIFITANAILIAENSAQIYNTMYFAGYRITNIIIGSLIGVVGTYIISYKSASKRINYLIAELLRSHARVLVYLQYSDEEHNGSIIKQKLDMDFDNLKMAYTYALGEFSKESKKLDRLWPAFFALEHMSYLLSKYCMDKGKLTLDEKQLGELILVYIRMANDIEQNREIQYKNIKEIEEISELCRELSLFQEAYKIR